MTLVNCYISGPGSCMSFVIQKYEQALQFLITVTDIWRMSFESKKSTLFQRLVLTPSGGMGKWEDFL